MSGAGLSGAAGRTNRSTRAANASSSSKSGKSGKGKSTGSVKIVEVNVKRAKEKVMKGKAVQTSLSPSEIEVRVAEWLAKGGQQRFEAAMEEAVRNGERFVRATRVRQETLTEPVTL